VSVGANIDANSRAETGVISTVVPLGQTNSPHVIHNIDINVPIDANAKELNQFFRRLFISNFKAEFSKIGGSKRYKNISGSKKFGDHHIDANIPSVSPNTEDEQNFTR
tara:strand:- start:8136 stop:8459 length:324 start_codon:yes stop_codon:yes gene_type:complete